MAYSASERHRQTFFSIVKSGTGVILCQEVKDCRVANSSMRVDVNCGVALVDNLTDQFRKSFVEIIEKLRGRGPNAKIDPVGKYDRSCEDSPNHGLVQAVTRRFAAVREIVL